MESPSDDVVIVHPDPRPGMAECPIVLEEGQKGGEGQTTMLWGLYG